MKGKTKAKLVFMSFDETSVFVEEQYLSALLCNNKLGKYFAPLRRYGKGMVLGSLLPPYPGFVPQLWALSSNLLPGKSHTDFPRVLPA